MWMNAMTELAIFSAPKPFTDPHIATIQRNAIRSWRALGPWVDVFLIGDEAGIAEAAAELGVQHLPGVRRSPQGTPQVDAMIELARAASDAPVLMLLNADIILMPNTVGVVKGVRHHYEDFLLVGRRHDLDVDEELSFHIGYEFALRDRVADEGKLADWNACDYFIFPRQLYSEVPAFSIGRAGWDNWMLYHAISAPWPAIDVTQQLMVVHQNHDYAHLPGGIPHYQHPETDSNIRAAGSMRNMRTLLDVPYELREWRVHKRPFSLLGSLHALENALQPDERVGRGLRWWTLIALRRLQKALIARGVD
jgi:hypothetical protein